MLNKPALLLIQQIVIARTHPLQNKFEVAQVVEVGREQSGHGLNWILVECPALCASAWVNSSAAELQQNATRQALCRQGLRRPRSCQAWAAFTPTNPRSCRICAVWLDLERSVVVRHVCFCTLWVRKQRDASRRDPITLRLPASGTKNACMPAGIQDGIQSHARVQRAESR